MRHYVDYSTEAALKIAVDRRMAILSRPNLADSAIKLANDTCRNLVKYYINPGKEVQEDELVETDQLRQQYESLVGHSIDSPEFAKIVDDWVKEFTAGQPNNAK